MSIIDVDHAVVLAEHPEIYLPYPTFAKVKRIVLHRGERRHETDPESKFVYALDKVVPVLNIYLDKGRTWQKNGVTLQILIDAKESKVAASPEVANYFQELITLLKEQENELFPR